MERVALYGGAFDPPHRGHLSAISLLLKSSECDQVWVLPSGDRPDKPGVSRAADRLAMIKLAIEGGFKADPRVLVSDLHCGNYGIGYGTIDLLDYCKSNFKDRDFSVVIGSELLVQLDNWKESARLKSECKFLIIDRPGESSVERSSSYKIRRVTDNAGLLVEISSSTIKERLKSGANIERDLDPKVLQYILKHGLYDLREKRS